MTAVRSTGSSPAAAGLAYTLGAYLFWGLSPIFWKALGGVPTEELVAHRVVWCALLMVPVLAWQGRLRGLAALLRRRRTLLALAGSTALIATNWTLFIGAMGSERVLEASLGYFINPLVTVLLGTVFLGERLRRAQWASVAIAGAGVLVLALRVGRLPWIALGLAFTFGFYSLLRKNVAASPEEGLAVETWLLSPIAAVHLAGLPGGGSLGHADAPTLGLLVATGVITAVPLVWFTHGARRLPLSTVGILQYLAPTMQFLLAVLAFREPFALPQLAAFALIWTALAVFTVDARAAWNRSPRGESAAGRPRPPRPAAE